MEDIQSNNYNATGWCGARKLWQSSVKMRLFFTHRWNDRKLSIT